MPQGPVVFPLISYLLTLTAFLCSINFYLGYRYNKKELFGRILNWFTIFVFVHAFYVWILEQFLPAEQWLDRMMPFAFVYGPFLYFSLRALKGNDLTRTRIFAHLLPFCIFLLLFSVTACKGWNNDPLIYKRIMRIHGLLSVFSLVGYSLFGIFSFGSKMVVDIKAERIIVLLGGMLMLFISVFFVVIMISKHSLENMQAVYMLRVTVYVCMFLVSLLVLGYLKHNLLLDRKQVFVTEPVKDGKESYVPAQYKKSKLTAAQLSVYSSALEGLMLKEQLFLDPELSLDALSTKMKVPGHHLTQVFSIALHTNFIVYINRLRINYACKLMEQGREKMTMEQMAAKSGFNSKVSFNRNFKAYKGCTPSAYRS